MNTLIANAAEQFLELLFEAAKITCQETKEYIKKLFQTDPNAQIFLKTLEEIVEEKPEVIEKIKQKLNTLPAHAPQYENFGTQIIYLHDKGDLRLKQQGVGMSCVYAFSNIIRTEHSTECF